MLQKSENGKGVTIGKEMYSKREIDVYIYGQLQFHKDDEVIYENNRLFYI